MYVGNMGASLPARTHTQTDTQTHTHMDTDTSMHTKTQLKRHPSAAVLAISSDKSLIVVSLNTAVAQPQCVHDVNVAEPG